MQFTQQPLMGAAPYSPRTMHAVHPGPLGSGLVSTAPLEEGFGPETCCSGVTGGAGQGQTAGCGGCVSGARQVSMGAMEVTSQTIYEEVGPGKGDYMPVWTLDYKYQPGGGYQKSEVKQWRGVRYTDIVGVCCCCLCFIFLAAVMFFFLWQWLPTVVVTTTAGPPTTAPIFFSTTTNRGSGGLTTRVPGVIVEGTCLVWGDPHFITFDHARHDNLNIGLFDMVRSQSIIIQGQMEATPNTNGLSVMREMRVGGPFLQNGQLVLGDNPTWNGKPIPCPVEHKVSDTVKFSCIRKTNPDTMDFHAMLPDHVMIFAQMHQFDSTSSAAYNFMNAAIIMRQQPGGQTGDCGNFNGDPSDDHGVDVPATAVFGNSPQFVKTGPKPDVNQNCPTGLANARAICQSKENSQDGSCLMDVCFGGERFAGNFWNHRQMAEQER